MTTNGTASDLIDSLDRHRGFLLHTAAGLTEEQARTRSTVSQLTIASLLKHVADTEELWMQFAHEGATAFERAFAAADFSKGDPRFLLSDEDTLDRLRERVTSVGVVTSALLADADLSMTHPLPRALWFEAGASWSVHRVALHLIAEISQHAGHADIIREAIDGQKTMG